MALDEMLEALEQEGNLDIEKIKTQAREHENQILKEAEEEAAKIRAANQKKVEDRVRIERSKILNRASFQVKKEVIRSKEAMMNDVFNSVMERIKALRKDGGYEPVFKSLATETLSGINGKAIVSVDPADEQLARKILDGIGREYVLKTDIKTLGGLSAHSEDGRIILNNTIDSRIAKAKQLLKTDVLKALFGEG